MCFCSQITQEDVISQMEQSRDQTRDKTISDRHREMSTNSHCEQEPNMSHDDTDEEDSICSYPGCKCLTSEVTWPFCYEHSPDSGWSPGALLYSWRKFVKDATDNKQLTSTRTISEHSNYDNDTEEKHKDEAQLPESDSEPESEEDICSYPGCDVLAPEVTWPFCYQHSPDSGLSPGGLLYCLNRYLEQEIGKDSATTCS